LYENRSRKNWRIIKYIEKLFEVFRIYSIVFVYYSSLVFGKEEREMANYPIETIRHSAAHVMAAAVQELYPNAKFDIGPSTEDGFYYDFDLPSHLSNEDLEKIEAKMNEIIEKNYPFIRTELSREDAQKILSGKGQNYKLERLADIPEDA